MEFGFGVLENGRTFASRSWEKPLNLTEREEELIDAILGELGELAPDVRTVRRCDDYVSLVYGTNDFVRVKATERVQWISIRMSFEDRKEWEDDPLFDSQKKKNRAHWKVKPASEDEIAELGNVLRNACKDYQN